MKNLLNWKGKEKAMTMPKYIEFETIKKKINDAQAEKEKFPFNGSLYETGYHNGLTMALTLAMYSTASDVAPVRHGRWLTWEEQFPAHIPSKKSGLGVFCSTCHKHADNMYDYCPNCGAKMDGGTP